jgi:hypothetical protein
MSADNGPDDRRAPASSEISRRDVILTVVALASAIGAGALAWGALEWLTSRKHLVGAGLNFTYVQVVMVLGTLVCVLGVVFCIRTTRGSAANPGLERLHPTDGADEMRLLRWQAWCAVVAFALTQVFLLVPGPYPMALFIFLAQPLFAIAAIGYLIRVRADLRQRGL